MFRFDKGFLLIWFILHVLYPGISAGALQGQELQLNDIRSRFARAVKSEESCNALYDEMLQAVNQQDAVFKAYLGVVTISMAKYTFNPFTKLNYFERGKKLVEAAIAKEPTNLELRFLRYTIQEHVPYFLGYAGDLKTDKKFMLDSLEHLQMPKLKDAIITYILNSAGFTSLEKQKVAAYH